MGRGVIDRPMEDIVHFLEAHERRKEWDKYLVVCSEHSNCGLLPTSIALACTH